MIAKVSLLMLMAALVLGVVYYVLHQLNHTRECAANMRTIYRALELYEIERGTLPRLAYFPNNPKEDADSMAVVLEPYGVSARTCICPAAPVLQADLGLTYIWNVRLNGAKIPRGQERQWMIVEMNALSTDVPAPHLGRYNVLYTDGSVEQVRRPQQVLPDL